MKNNILGILLLIIVLPICAVEYNTYEMEEVHIFSASHFRAGGELDLTVNNHPGSGDLSHGPALFFKGNQMVLSDEVYYEKRRTIFLNKDFTFNKIHNGSFYNMNVVKFSDAFIGINPSNLKYIDSSKGWDTKFSSSQDVYSILQGYKDVYYQDDTLFIYDKDFKLWAIKDPSLDNDKNLANIIKEDEIIKEINTGKYKDLTIDDEKRLLLNGKLQTTNISTFFKYTEIKEGIKLPLFEKGNKENFFIRNNASFLQRDHDGNTYWYYNNRILVSDIKGIPQHNILLNKVFFIPSYPAVSPQGDIFFLNYGEDKVILYKIPRKW